MSLFSNGQRANQMFVEVFNRLVANKDIQCANFKDVLIRLVCLNSKNIQNIVILIEMMKYNSNLVYLMYNGTGDADKFYSQCLRMFSYDPSKSGQQSVAPKSELISSTGSFEKLPIQYSKSKFRNWNKGKYAVLFKEIEDFIKPDAAFITHYSDIAKRQFDECSDSVKYSFFNSLTILKNEEILVDNLMHIALTNVKHHESMSEVDGYDAAIRELRSNEMDNYLLCPVCFTNKRRQVVFSCGHKLCLQCYYQLTNSHFSSKVHCPTCRREVTTVRDTDKFEYPKIIAKKRKIDDIDGTRTAKQVTVTGLLTHFVNVSARCPIVSNAIKFNPVKKLFVPMIPNK